MGERYPLQICCHGIERFSYLFENLCPVTLESGEHPLRTPTAYKVLFEKSPCDLINVSGPFSVICNYETFIKLNLPVLQVLVRQREKSQTYFHFSAFK